MLAFAAEPADAPPDQPPHFEREAPGSRHDPFRDKLLKRALHKIVPAVERAAGRRFLAPPVVELAEDEPFQAMVRAETALIYEVVHRDTPPALRERIVAEATAGIQPGLLGKYGMFEDTLFLCPDNLRLAAVEIGDVAVSDLATVVLAHELVHALHDQHANLARLVRGLPDRDALWALMGTSEGLANFVEGRVAAELGLSAVHEKMNRLQGWTDEGPLRPEAFRIWSHYGLGSQMMAHHFAEGGLERVWAVALSPPTQTRALFRPETWPNPRPAPSVDYAAVPPGHRAARDPRGLAPFDLALGEAPLWAEAYGAGAPERVDAVLARIREAWSLEGVRPDRQAQIRVLVFDAPEGARDYLALLRDHDRGLAIGWGRGSSAKSR